VIDDIEESWDYPSSQQFDYIHQRSMAGSIANWSALYKQALKNMKPGGWFEIQEFDVWFHSQNPGGLPQDSAIVQWQTLIDQASVQVGKKLNCGAELGAHLESAGFENMQSQVIKVSVAACSSPHPLFAP
jgi:predicted methyltransferase